MCDRRWGRTAPQAWRLGERPGVAGPMRNLELSALRILTRGAVAGAADVALTASMGWVRPPFRPRSRHQRVLGGRHAQRHRVRDGRLTLGRCSDRGLMADMVPVGAIVSSLPHVGHRFFSPVISTPAACCLRALCCVLVGGCVPCRWPASRSGGSGSCSTGWASWERRHTGVRVERTVARQRCGGSKRGS